MSEPKRDLLAELQASVDRARASRYEWGIRDHPTHGLDLWEDWHAVPPEPFTEKTARDRAREGFWSGYQLLRRAPGAEPEVVDYRPSPLPAPSSAELAPEVKEGLPVGLLGEDSDWAVALGHVEPGALAKAATERIRDLHMLEIDDLDPARVKHVHAIRVDGEWGGDTEGNCLLVWQWPDKTPVTVETPGAFPLTILDVTW